MHSTKACNKKDKGKKEDTKEDGEKKKRKHALTEGTPKQQKKKVTKKTPKDKQAADLAANLKKTKEHKKAEAVMRALCRDSSNEL